MSKKQRKEVTGNDQDRKARQQLVSFGAGAYWGGVLLNLLASASTFQFSDLFVSGTSGSAVIAYPLAMMAVLVLALVFAKRFFASTFQKLLAAGTIIGAALCLVTTYAAPSSSTIQLAVASLGSGVSNACAILFWGLNFTTLEKHGAEKAALAALTIALMIYLIVSLLPLDDTATQIISAILIMASVVPFLTGRYRISAEQRKGEKPDGKVLGPFFASRFLLGACYGGASFLSAEGLVGERACSYALVIIALAVLITFTISQSRDDVIDIHALVIAPFIAGGAIACPFAFVWDIGTVFVACAPSIVWLAWSTLHSVQLPVLKRSAGLDDCTLAFSEKIVFVASFMITELVLGAIPQIKISLEADAQLQASLAAITAFVAVAFCCYQLSRIIVTKASERITDKALELSEQRNEPVLEKIAADYDLTARELDVLRVLAKGQTRSAICEELCISEGTARTHVAHIYSKLDVHSRTELLNLIEDETREFVAK